MTTPCRSVACNTLVLPPNDFCIPCLDQAAMKDDELSAQTMSNRYPENYKDLGDLSEIDVFAVHELFQIVDFSGCLHDASRKLLMSSVRNGTKTQYENIKEARDSLTRWLQLNALKNQESQ